MHLNFARRPFRDYRPVYLAAGAAILAGGILFAVNAGLYGEFRRDVADTREEIAWLEQRQQRATAAAEEARSALASYELSELADESRGLLGLVEERKFSWLTLLGRLERVLPPEVRLSRLQPRFQEGQIEVDIALIGRSPASVVRTLAALARSPHFTAIELKSESRPDGPAAGVPEGYSFVLSTVYDPGGAP